MKIYALALDFFGVGVFILRDIFLQNTNPCSWWWKKPIPWACIWRGGCAGSSSYLLWKERSCQHWLLEVSDPGAGCQLRPSVYYILGRFLYTQSFSPLPLGLRANSPFYQSSRVRGRDYAKDFSKQFHSERIILHWDGGCFFSIFSFSFIPPYLIWFIY